MSSINLSSLLSKSNVFKAVWALLAKSSAAPFLMGFSGLVVVGRALVFTTLGRIAVLVLLSLGLLAALKVHFANVEAHKWEASVQKKQSDIIDRVSAVNVQTKQSQDASKGVQEWWARVTAVVVDGIWKVQPPHPIESETIDLINETRGKQPAAK